MELQQKNMRQFWALLFFGCSMFSSCAQKQSEVHTTKQETQEVAFQDGDIIFQTSNSSQSKAIQLATQSVYSHMGIIYQIDGEWMVYEAIQPVQLTALSTWIARGKEQHYVVKRLRQSEEVLTPSAIAKMKAFGEGFHGKAYDIYFEWSDERIYCSELVWKIYKHATGIEIGQLEELKDFDLSSKAVQDKMQERYGSNIPMNEKVISPAAIFQSPLLLTVAPAQN